MDRKQLGFYDERDDLEAYRQFIEQNRHPIALLLDRVTNARNIGSLYRLADAARLEHIYAYQFEEYANGKKIKRVARAANEFVPFQPLKTLEEVKKLREKYQFVALEVTNTSIPYATFTPEKPCLLIIGNEQNGVSKELLDLAEKAIHIPMFGINTSMNVAMSTGIAVYGLLQNMGLVLGDS